MGDARTKAVANAPAQATQARAKPSRGNSAGNKHSSHSASVRSADNRALGNRALSNRGQGSRAQSNRAAGVQSQSRSLRVATGESPVDARKEAQADEVAEYLLHEHAPPESTRIDSHAGNTRAAPRSVATALSGGEALAPTEQLEWGRLLNRDLSDVRIHRDRRSALAIGARAYAYGSHVAFAPGEYRAGSALSRRLLAHELAHVALHDDSFIHRTPGAGVDHVEVDCAASEIIFYQANHAYRYTLTWHSPDLAAREYTATVEVGNTRLYFVGGGFRFQLDNDAHEGNPFDLFGAQSEVQVVVWNTGRATGPDAAPDGPTTDESAGGSGSGGGSGAGGESGSGGRTGADTEPQHGVRITSLASDDQRQLVLRVLRLIYGDHRPDEAPPLDTFITLADIDALRRLEMHPQRDAIIAMLRSGHGGTESYDYANVLDSAIAIVELGHYGDLFDFHFSTSSGARPPLVPRPVHGRIEGLSGNLVPGKQGVFQFVQQDREVVFAVPLVYIRWYASRNVPGQDRPEIIERETVNYNAVDADSFLNDQRFEVTFDEVGDYEIHAFVLHSFFLPAHFSIPVNVATEEERLRAMEADEEAQFGTVESTDDNYTFGDVRRENTIVRIGLIAGTRGAVPLSLLFSDDPDALGSRRTGELSAARRDPAAALTYIDEQITRVTALRDRYREREQADLIAWANDRLDQLTALRGQVTESISGTGNHPVAVDGYFISRAGGGEGRLRVASWFTYDSTANEYHGVLIDYSQLVRNTNFRFEADGDEFDAVYERLFFYLSSTYPSGRMRFSYQQYNALTATNRFVQFERNTDTLLNDIQEVAFSAPVSIAVNVAAAILTVFPATMPLGIAISLAYNGADAALNFMDASRSGTVTASNYLDLGLVAVDVIPLIGRALRVGATGMRILRVGSELVQWAGNFYVFSERAYEQIEELRSGDVQRLADLQSEINTLVANHAPADEIERRREEERRLVASIRARAEEVLLNNAAMMGLQLLSQAAAKRLVTGVANRRGWTTVADIEAAREAAARRGEVDPDVRLIDEAGGEVTREDLADSDLIRRATEDAGRRPEIATDPVLSLGLPERLQSEVPVMRTEGEHGSVRVRAEPGTFGVGRIWIEAGRLASAADIRDHVAAVDLLRQYQGFTGSVRAAMEYAVGLVRGLPPEAVRRGRELRGEIEKLPGYIRRNAAELEASRHALSADEIAAEEARIRDLESQLDGYRRELAGLNADSRSVGYIAALDRLTEGMDRDISASLPPQQIRGARTRLELARQILNRIMRRAEGMTSDTDATIPPETATRLRGILRDMVMDPVFGQAALEDLQNRTRTRDTDPTVRRRGSTTPLADELARNWPSFEAADAERRSRLGSDEVTREAVAAHRARTDVPAADADQPGNIAAGVLFVDRAGGRERVGDVMMGTSPHSTTPDTPIDPRYRKRRASGTTETFAVAIDHAEQTVLGRAARTLEAEFPGAAPASITGELRMHVEGEPCFNCLAGIPGTREQAGAGPFAQFSREFSGVSIIVTFDGPPAGSMTIQNGVIVSTTFTP